MPESCNSGHCMKKLKLNLYKLIISNKNIKLHFLYIETFSIETFSRYIFYTCTFCKTINGFKVGSRVGGWGETQEFLLPHNADLI